MPRKKKTETPVLIPEGYTYSELRPLVETTLKARISVLLRGHPGVGKSALAKDLAQAMKLPLIDIRLAQRDPAELCGVYFPDHAGNQLKLLPPEWVKQACSEPCLVFLDEINSAVTRLHQAAAYQIVLEHRVGNFQFHPETAVMGAGNLEEDNAIVTSLSSALCNRFAHFIMRPDISTWLEWGARNGIDDAILAYIAGSSIDELYDNNGDFAFPTPRSWEMASRVYQLAQPGDQKRAMAACIGPAAADRFFAFHRIFGQVDVQGIIDRGVAIDFSKGKKAEPSFIYAAVFAVAAGLSERETLSDNQVANVAAFMASPGLDPEFLILFLRQLKYQSRIFDLLKPDKTFQQIAAGLVSIQAMMYQ
ncbi:MAG: AAA family ATPase [Candidatus Riflebacteria bacterium]